MKNNNTVPLSLPSSLTAANVRLEYEHLANRYNRMVTALVEEVMDHDGCDGCMSGKVEFLENLGLEAPKNQYSVVMTITVNPADHSEADEVREEILHALRDRFDETVVTNVEVDD